MTKGGREGGKEGEREEGMEEGDSEGGREARRKGGRREEREDAGRVGWGGGMSRSERGGQTFDSKYLYHSWRFWDVERYCLCFSSYSRRRPSSSTSF